MKEKIFNAFRIVVLAFILSSAIGYSLADWTPPSGTPPFNNVPPPINVGATTQVKDGNLFVKRFWAQKAQSLSTVAGDTGDTLVTKDYVDGKGGDMKWITGAGCATCPYGSYIIRWDGSAREQACFFKDQYGTLFKPAESASSGNKIGAMCYVNYYDFTGPGFTPTFLFWTY